MINVQDVMHVADSERAARYSLSKGGWEGWLQCELWGYLGIDKSPNLEVEREVRYPNTNYYCDLVVGGEIWVEIKAVSH